MHASSVWDFDLIPAIFFDFEVVFNVLFQLGTEESTSYGQISISALGLDTDLGFSRGHQGHRSWLGPDLVDSVLNSVSQPWN